MGKTSVGGLAPDGSMIPAMRISLLGGFELAGQAESVRSLGKKPAALLAYLACNQEKRHPREKLTALLWSAHPELQARQSLRQALSNIRKIIGPARLIACGDTISLRPGSIECDVCLFQALIRDGSTSALERAVELYKGTLLADCTLDEEHWSEWLSRERQRLEDLALDALLRLGEAYLEMQRPCEALQLAHRAISMNVLREDAHRLAIRAYVATGRTIDAIRRYNALVALLDQELGIKPDEITQKLVARILAANQSGLPAPECSTSDQIERTDATSHFTSVRQRTPLGINGSPSSESETATRPQELLHSYASARNSRSHCAQVGLDNRDQEGPFGGVAARRAMARAQSQKR